jgi:tetratricopeptide (TPR) repeat protein
MDVDRLLAWVETVVLGQPGGQLSELQKQIFTAAWGDHTYEAIAKSLGYEESYVRDVGAQLFRLLKKQFDEPAIGKSNFQLILQRCYDRAVPVEPIANAPPDHPRLLEDQRRNFLGRQADLDAITQHLTNHPIVLIHGEGGLGKTTLARKYLELHQYRMLSIWMPAESQTMVTPVALVVEEWLRGEFGLDAGRDFGINLDRLRRCFKTADPPIGILIDNLESALDGHGGFAEPHRCYLELLRLLADPSLSVITLITSREQLKESTVTPMRYHLSGLSEAVWHEYFQHHRITITVTSLAEIWRACLGNPKAMEILKGAAISEFDGDLEAYWHSCGRNLLMNRTVEHLVQSQITAIATSNPAAYRLLCRLGAYRYQNNSSIDSAGVNAMLWDVPPAQQSAVIQSLRDRSLLESRKNQIFWLHPLLQSEAWRRLRDSADWEISHRQAGAFWLNQTTSVNTVDDAQRLLEAYHHYLEIDDYEQACEVLITCKPNCWNTTIAVGWLFYRFSLLQQITIAITRIVPHIPTDSRAGRLYNLLGYVCRLCGEPKPALQHHQTALAIAQALTAPTTPDLEIQQLIISTRFNLGLCYRDLWELPIAVGHFQDVKLISTAANVIDYAIYADCCLAYIYSCQGDRAQAMAHIRQIPTIELQLTITSWGKASSLLYLASTYRNIGDIEAAIELYQDTLQFAQSQQFTHIVAKANHGMAQVNRIRQRYDEAFQQHAIAIDRLQQITARCDLAEAYIQRAITHREVGNAIASQADFAEAIGLLKAIDAPHRLAWLESIMAESPHPQLPVGSSNHWMRR